jgi:aspartate/methionine/tyrosine aminotransferase
MIENANRLQSVKEYYFSQKLREVRGLVGQGKPIINMGIGSPDLPPSQKVLDALTDAISHPSAHQYQSYQGLPELREEMANFYKTYYGVSLDPTSEVLPLMGSKEGIMHISMAFLNPGDKVLVPNPGYPTYTSVTRLVEAEPLFYNLEEKHNWFPQVADLEKMDLSGVKLMWLGYPHMPTGAVAEDPDLESLIAFAKKHQILLVKDNPYSFVLNKTPKSILALEGAKEVVLELNSLSKSFNMAGWRVGMLMGRADLVEAVLKVKSNMDSGMFYGIQKGAIEALKAPKSWFDGLNEIYAKRRKAIFALADKLNLSYDPSAVGMFVWAKISNNHTTSEMMVDQLLYEHDIFIAPGTIFGSNGEGYVRFSLCVPEEKIVEALNRFN